MSVPAPDSLLTAFAAALLASVLGSVHCLAMCGPLRIVSGADKRSRALYQSGRFLAYAALGAGAGMFGSSIPPSYLLALLVIAGVGFLTRIRFPFPSAASRHLGGFATGHPFFLGAFSGLLPCGLLHGWLLAAAATANPYRGALILGALWLGTLPALEAAPTLTAKPWKRIRQRFPRAAIMAVVLVAAAPLLWRAHLGFAAPGNAGPVACHGHMEQR